MPGLLVFVNKLWYNIGIMLDVWLFFVGAAVGGFLMASAERGTLSGVWREVSRCGNCTLPIPGHHQIPVLSWIFLRGRCRRCRVGIPFIFLAAELAFGLLFLFLVRVDGFNITLARDFFFTAALGLLFLFDLRRMTLPVRIIVPLIILAALFPGISADWPDILRAVAALVAFFGAQYLISRGRWIGSGDILMGVLLGVLLGTSGAVLAVIIAYILGAAVGIVLLLLGLATRTTAVPLGVFLSVGGWVAMMWGERLLAFFL